jgi:2,3-bisphosphoglycerate-independent phosphoglycerate mutase
MLRHFKKTALIIMDGWGHGQKASADAIQQSKAQYVKSLYKKFPNAELITCGTDVGLPEGQMGNSEVGHLNLGAGRIVYQELERINVAIREGELQKNANLLSQLNYVKANGCALHLLGLLSDGGVHSHINHLKALCDIVVEHDVQNVFIHAFTDGRDTDPNGGVSYLKDLQAHLQDKPQIKIASITGRYYAMDRDKRWERVALAYEALVHGKGELSKNAIDTLQQRYAAGETDEFIKPIILEDNGKIKSGDAVLCFNFRTDRCREITVALSQQDMPEHHMQKLDLNYCTFTEYDKTYKNVSVLFQQTDLVQTLGEVIADNGLTQVRMAETEKYPHVSFFFSGGREQAFEGEQRIMEPSPKDVATYDLKPEMSAIPLTEAALKFIEEQQPNFMCLNFANADMVGHTGVFSAAMKAAEMVDACVEKLVAKLLANDYAIVLTADHGNSDYMINEDGSPNTAHTLNPVPVFIIANDFSVPMHSGRLADVAPTILKLMGLEQPKEMTGKALF